MTTTEHGGSCPICDNFSGISYQFFPHCSPSCHVYGTSGIDGLLAYASELYKDRFDSGPKYDECSVAINLLCRMLEREYGVPDTPHADPDWQKALRKAIDHRHSQSPEDTIRCLTEGWVRRSSVMLQYAFVPHDVIQRRCLTINYWGNLLSG